MGAWGLESCSNDSCWDNLHCEDIHAPTNKEIKDSLAQAHDALRGDLHEQEIFLGIAVWGLTHNTEVPVAELKRALKVAKRLLKDEDYLSAWVVPNRGLSRAEHLDQEIKLIESAIANGGKSPVLQTAPEGLMEKFGRPNE